MGNEKKRDKCDYNSFKRTRYFHGQLMTDREFREEQIYHDGKRKLLNRMLHGWGVVCGLEIAPKEGCVVTIGCGLAIDAAGNEIYVDQTIDANIAELVKQYDCESKEKDPCKESETDENKWYVVLKYKEVPTDPVPVYIPGGGCEEKVCDYSRIKEGYCIELRRDGCTAADESTLCDTLNPDSEDFREKFCNGLLLPCPSERCEEDGVILGSITFDGPVTSQSVINADMINNWDCRKYLITFELLQYWLGKLGSEKVTLDAIVQYGALGAACRSESGAADLFHDICNDQENVEKVKVPDVVNKKVREAEEILKASSLRIGRVGYEYNDDESLHNTVYKQQPEKDTMVPRGSSVDLWVYKFEKKKKTTTVEKVPGIGKVSAIKLKREGIESIVKLAEADPKRVAKILSTNEVKAENFVLEAKKMVGK